MDGVILRDQPLFKAFVAYWPRFAVAVAFESGVADLRNVDD